MDTLEGAAAAAADQEKPQSVCETKTKGERK